MYTHVLHSLCLTRAENICSMTADESVDWKLRSSSYLILEQRWNLKQWQRDGQQLSNEDVTLCFLRDTWWFINIFIWSGLLPDSGDGEKVQHADRLQGKLSASFITYLKDSNALASVLWLCALEEDGRTTSPFPLMSACRQGSCCLLRLTLTSSRSRCKSASSLQIISLLY